MDQIAAARYSAAAQKQKGTSNIDDVLQRNLAKAEKQFGDMLDRAGIKPEKLQQGIDPHSGQLETTRAAKAEAKIKKIITVANDFEDMFWCVLSNLI